MSEQPEPQRKSHTWTWVMVAMAVPVLYVLSIGPAWALMMGKFPDPFARKPQWYGTVYGPAEYLAWSAGCGEWLENYELWCQQWMPER